MSSFENLFNRHKTSKEFLIERANYQKNQIISQLNLCFKEIEYDLTENGISVLAVTETSSTLCSIIEAVFLHGIKNSFLKTTFNVLTGINDDRRPDVNFWPPLLVISHKYIIEKIESLTQVNTEIGYCRAWVRLSLNDSLLSSFLATIRRNVSIISNYYHQWAYLRDLDTVEFMEKIIENLETTVKFEQPINSSLLNNWTDWTLELSGLWSAPIKNYPIASGIDIASSLVEDAFETIEEDAIEECEDVIIAAEESENLSNSVEKFPVVDGITGLPVRCLTPEPNSVDEIIEKLNKNLIESTGVEPDEDTSHQDSVMTKSHSMGNSIISRTGWSSNHEMGDLEFAAKTSESHSNQISRMNSMTTSINSPVDRDSFHAILEKYEGRSFSEQKLKFNELWERFESTLNADIISVRSTVDEHEERFVIGTDMTGEKYSIEELQMLVEQTCKLAHEAGLDSQGYICKSCANPLGIGFSKAQVCAFTGHYYCDSCMSPEQFTIPAKIIYNWDFKKYPVSISSAKFFTDFQHKPFIDMKLVNPDIYTSVIEMAELQTLRIQLNFIRAYVFTCCEKTIEKLKEIVDQNEYYHDHIYRYSISDLNAIPKGKLYTLFEKCVNFGRDHIKDCPLCSQKGFICEICNSPKVLYPFDIKMTFRCELCGTIYHEKCLDETKPCPKCDRMKRRQDLPLLEIAYDNDNV